MNLDPGVDLDAIEARMVRITPGPWEPNGTTVQTVAISTRVAYEGLGLHDEVARCAMTTGNYQSEARNAAFLAAAREDIPALVAEVRRLRALVAQQVP